MNFRVLTVPALLGGRVLAALAAATLTVWTTAYAQQPATPKAATKAAPKAAPGAPAGQAPATSAPAAQAQQQPADQQVQLIYAPWTKFCLKAPDANAKQICFTGKDGRIESGRPVIAAVIIEPDGEPKKILRLTLPLGMQLVHGTRAVIDSNTPQQAPYVICFTNGCMSDYEATPEMIANLKKGQNLIVQAINQNGSPLTLPLPLTESGGSFAKAYDGPPTDPKAFEENNKKLQEELQKRANEARQRLEAAQPPTASVTPNAAAK